MEHAMKIDPIKRELIKNALVTICDNMLVMIVRTARSTNIKNTMDFSATICDADGQLVAQGLAVPAHLGAMMPALKGCLDYFGSDIAEDIPTIPPDGQFDLIIANIFARVPGLSTT